MIVTDSGQFADRLRRLRHHGMNQTDWQRHQQAFPGRESYGEVGFNYRLSDVCAAVGVAQMQRLEELLQTRKCLATQYDEAFCDLDGQARLRGIRISSCPYDAEPNGQTYAVVVEEHSSLDRNPLVVGLRKHGIAAKAGPACIHREPCYANGLRSSSLNVSETLDERMLLLPLHPSMTEKEQRHVVSTLVDLLDPASRFAGAPRSAAKRDLEYPGTTRVIERLVPQPAVANSWNNA